MVSLVGHAANGLVSVLLAPSCAVCDAILDQPLNGPVCKICWAAIRPITPPICDVCGDPLARYVESRIHSSARHSGFDVSGEPKETSLHRCTRCSGRERAVARARAVGEYEGALREIVHALKYEARRSLARPLAALMRSRGNDLLQGADWIVPVPLHWQREYSRGFNQARELANWVGLPVIELLRRNRPTASQIELPADRRQANVQGAFELRRAWLRRTVSLDGRKIVLVDDVSTTGATLEACASVLKQAGASEVCALTAARVITRL